MARPPRSNGAETRENILDVAQQLFTDQGYDKTSLRDIAERLGITKAALYYYFERKEDILLELHLRFHALGTAMLDEMEQIPDGPERVKAWPRMMDSLIEGIAGSRELLMLHRRNQAAIYSLHDNARNQLENDELEARLVVLLSSAKIPVDDRVRMAAAVGIFTEVLVESNDAFGDLTPDELAGHVRRLIAELFAHTGARDPALQRAAG